MAVQDKPELDQVMELARVPSAVTRACACAVDSYREWSRVPPGFPQAQMRAVGTPRGDPYADPTYAEAGAYYTEPRVRALDPAPIVDAPLPA
jgi:hypothetical protein